MRSIPPRNLSRRTAGLVSGSSLLVAGSAVFLGTAHAGVPAAAAGGGARSVTAAALAARAVGLDDPRKKEIAMELVSSAENSSLDWKAQYAYIEDIGDGRGYTAGIIGFCSGTGDMLELVQAYTDKKPDNVLAKYLPALRRVNGSDSHSGLGSAFERDWRAAAKDSVFRQAQDAERDRVYFDPAVKQAKQDGLRALGQFIYYDAIVMHGPGNDKTSFGGIRKTALARAKPSAQGGDETVYLNEFLDARKAAMKTEEAHSDTSRVDTEQRVFLQQGNFDLDPPLHWKVYGDSYSINS
jgi:chitosanase